MSSFFRLGAKLVQHYVGEAVELPLRIFGQIGFDHFRIGCVSHGLPESDFDAGIGFASSTVFHAPPGQFGKLSRRKTLQIETVFGRIVTLLYRFPVRDLDTPALVVTVAVRRQ